MIRLILIIIFFMAGGVYADEVRMATSEDIDLFDQAVEASTDIEKNIFKPNRVKPKTKLRGKSNDQLGSDYKSDKYGHRERGPRKDKDVFGERDDYREERSSNKRRNKKRKRN